MTHLKIPVQKAKERKRTSEAQCTESRQLASEQKWTDEQESEAINKLHELNGPWKVKPF